MAGAERTEVDETVPEGSVTGTLDLLGERIVGGKPERKKTLMPVSQNQSSKQRELHFAKKEINRFNSNREYAEAAKAQAEYELSNSKKMVEDLTLQIQKSKASVRSNKLEFRHPKNPEKSREEQESSHNRRNDQYTEVLRELETVKRELKKLKLDVSSVLREKSKAEKETEDSISTAKSGSISAELLRKEIEEADGEHVLVELATMEALQEFEEIEAQRDEESAEFSINLEKTRKRIEGLTREVSDSKHLDKKLSVTNSDLAVLQDELKRIKEMERRNPEIKSEISPKNLSALMEEISKTREEESATSSLLKSAMAELKAAKKELQTIREEGFQFMTSMDIIRSELKHVSEETEKFKSLEQKSQSTAHDLNSKLQRAKSKLEEVTPAVKKAKANLKNLTMNLQQLETEAEAAKKEIEASNEETASLRLEIQNKEANIYLAEEKLQSAMQELEAVKTAETIALENLRNLTEKNIKARTSSSLHSSTITISSFEYDYLSRRAETVNEMAGKKVAAAQAWIEAIRIEEKEILMKTELVQREIGEIRAVEEQVKEDLEREMNSWREQEKEEDETVDLQTEMRLTGKPMKANSIPSSSKGNKIVRTIPSPGTLYHAGQVSLTLKKKKKVMPNLGKFFRNMSVKKRAQEHFCELYREEDEIIDR